MKLGAALAVFGLCGLAALPAIARETEHFFAVQEAFESGVGKKKSDDIAIYFKGQKHPSVTKTVGTWEANRHSRGVFRSDKSSCQVAFMSAILSLQERARREGGNALIGVVSITQDRETSSATEYRCVAGATVVHVALKGTVVKLAK